METTLGRAQLPVDGTHSISTSVNSLSAPTEGHGGKIDFLRRQFIDFNFNFMGVQESKSPEFCSCVDHVLRLSSGCHKNQQGVESWVNLSQPYAYVNNQPVFLDKGDIQVAHKDPRALLARIETIYWQCWLLVAYAPHTGLPLGQREQWWTSLAELAHRRGRDEQMIVLLDANAAPGPRDDIAVFTTGLPESANTPLFRGFVEEHGLFLPCTTPAHHGDITAWTDPTGTHRHCIEYVLLSHHFDKSCTLSRVVSEFDLGTLHWDHEPTAVHLASETWIPHRQKQHKDSLGFDPSLINKAVAHQVLRSYTPKSWTTGTLKSTSPTSISTFCQGFVRHALCLEQSPKSPTSLTRSGCCESASQEEAQRLDEEAAR